LAPAIVEFYDGQIIYAGGDDVLAMLPAGHAIECAIALRLAFQGDHGLVAHLRKHDSTAVRVPVLIAKHGFVSIDGEWEGFKRYQRFLPRGVPLLVPGPRATVSAGIAIGHMREPLQDMVREAQQAEKRAKADPQRKQVDRTRGASEYKLNEGWGRDALAVTLFKRSGETIRWGAKFSPRDAAGQARPSAGLPLLEYLGEFYRAPVDQPDREMPIRGKFPYRIAELLRRYEIDRPLSEPEKLRDIASHEVAFAIQRQTKELDGSAFSTTQLQELCDAYLDELLHFHWHAEGVWRPAARPLREFINLFALEAFISRAGE
jgi:hypothetical protein